jgi:hypothetical protein
MITAVWIAVAAALSLWSLLAWGIYRLLLLDPRWLGELDPVIQQVPYGDWLERWLPGWQALVTLAIDTVQAALGWLGAAAPVVVGIAWGVGAVLLLAGGGLLTLVIALLRDKPGSRAA